MCGSFAIVGGISFGCLAAAGFFFAAGFLREACAFFFAAGAFLAEADFLAGACAFFFADVAFFADAGVFLLVAVFAFAISFSFFCGSFGNFFP
jgi:hypothetical protein